MRSFKKNALVGLMILTIFVNGCAATIGATTGMVAGAVTCPPERLKGAPIPVSILMFPLLAIGGAGYGLLKGWAVGFEADMNMTGDGYLNNYKPKSIEEITHPCK